MAASPVMLAAVMVGVVHRENPEKKNEEGGWNNGANGAVAEWSRAVEGGGDDGDGIRAGGALGVQSLVLYHR